MPTSPSPYIELNPGSTINPAKGQSWLTSPIPYIELNPGITILRTILDHDGVDKGVVERKTGLSSGLVAGWSRHLQEIDLIYCCNELYRVNSRSRAYRWMADKHSEMEEDHG